MFNSRQARCRRCPKTISYRAPFAARAGLIQNTGGQIASGHAMAQRPFFRATQCRQLAEVENRCKLACRWRQHYLADLFHHAHGPLCLIGNVFKRDAGWIPNLDSFQNILPGTCVASFYDLLSISPIVAR